MTDSEQLKELVAECSRLEESRSYTAVGIFEWQKRTRFWKNIFISAPIVFGAIASSQLLTTTDSQTIAWIPAILALLAGLFPALFEALGMEGRVLELREVAGRYTCLRDRFRQLGNFAPFEDKNEAMKRLRKLTDQLGAVWISTPPVPERFFAKGREKIQRGDYWNSVDKITN